MKLTTPAARRLVVALAVGVGVAWLVSTPRAEGTGQSFATLQSGFTQDLYGVTGDFDVNNPLAILGGVAFAPDGDVWSSECVFLGTRLHRFDQDTTYAANGTTLHPETVVDLTTSAFGPAGGCGLVNHPNGFMYTNSSEGIWELDAETGLPTGPAMVHPPQTDAGGAVVRDFGDTPLRGGNALGIAIDPQTHHLVYVGDDCHPSLSASVVCTYWDLDPVSGEVQVFARFDRTDAFVDGIYFDPSGEFVFSAYRALDAGTGAAQNSLLVLHRPVAVQPADTPVDNTQVVRQVPMVSEPDGVAFHATTGVVVTLNESADCMTPDGALVSPVLETLVDEFGDPYANVESCPEYVDANDNEIRDEGEVGVTAVGGTMSVFDFQGDYASAPTHHLFATGGFRGDLLQVGADGCIYATQGALFDAGQTTGTRYDDGTETPENGIVRICGGFTPPPGVPEVEATGIGDLSGVVYADVNRNSVRDGGEPGIGGVTVTLGDAAAATTVSAPDGSYSFAALEAGSYTLSAPAIAAGKALFTASPLSVSLAAEASSPNHDFGYVTGDLSGFAYVDANRNSAKDSGEAGIGGVVITLASGGTTTTAADGSYTFTTLDAATYSVSAPATAASKLLFTASPLSVSLTAGASSPNHDFGYVPGDLSGVVYADLNRNGVRDGGEPGISGVTVTLGDAATATTSSAADGSYSFAFLDAGSYTLSAPAIAAGKALFTASPLSVSLAMGASSPNHDFGYVTGDLSGFAYIDANRNSVKDGGEAGIGGVVITLASGGTTTTMADGSYSFAFLDAGNYTLSAPATAVGKALFTASPLSVSLAAGASSPNHDFGYVTGGLSGVAYVDENRNSARDGGEAGIGGVVITLASGGTTTTAADGSYSFATLDAGDYAVSAPATAAGKNLGTASPLSVSLTAGASSPNHDFGYVTSDLSGTVYADLNRNDMRDVGEPGIGGVTVTLAGTSAATTISAADGTYTLTGLEAGAYTVSAPATTAGGQDLGTPSPLTVSLAVGVSSPNHDFGYVTSDLSGVVYADLNRNSTRDGGEPGIGGVTVTLGGTATATTTSAADGSYSFAALVAGGYTVSAPATASGKALFTASPLSVSLAAGASSPNHDFGYVTGDLSGVAYVDANRNSVRDGGEAGIAGVVITLASGGTTTTAADGSYSFGALDAATYSVSAPATAASKLLFTASPLSVNLAAGASSPNHNFGYVPGSLSGFAYLDANQSGTKDGGEVGLSGVPIAVAGSGTANTAADGSYTFSSLNAATYAVSAPAVASGYTLSTPSPLSVPLAAGQTQPNINFGYVDIVVPNNAYFCEKQTVQSELDPSGSHFFGNQGPDVVVQAHKGQSIQAAIDAAADLNGDGFIIVAVVAKDGGLLGGNVTQSVVINRVFTLKFALFACSVTITDPTPSDANPTARITSTASAPPDALGARIFVMDLHASGSSVAGWLVEGNNRYLRNVEARNNLVGIKFVGDSNTMHNGAVESNQGTGLIIQGNSNKVDSTDAFSNAGHGILVTGNTNQVLKTDVGDKNKGNGGDGLHVEGAGNTLSETSAFANLGDGIEVVAASGSANVLKKNVSGDKSGKSNAGNGILVAGPGNGAASPIELDQNTVKANGLVGIRITGTGHQLKNNVSGGSGSGETNTGCEFNIASGNFNATGNKANGSTVAGSNGSAFPAGCVGN